MTGRMGLALEHPQVPGLVGDTEPLGTTAPLLSETRLVLVNELGYALLAQHCSETLASRRRLPGRSISKQSVAQIIPQPPRLLA